MIRHKQKFSKDLIRASEQRKRDNAQRAERMKKQRAQKALIKQENLKEQRNRWLQAITNGEKNRFMLEKQREEENYRKSLFEKAIRIFSHQTKEQNDTNYNRNEANVHIDDISFMETSTDDDVTNSLGNTLMMREMLVEQTQIEAIQCRVSEKKCSPDISLNLNNRPTSMISFESIVANDSILLSTSLNNNENSPSDKLTKAVEMDMETGNYYLYNTVHDNAGIKTLSNNIVGSSLVSSTDNGVVDQSQSSPIPSSSYFHHDFNMQEKSKLQIAFEDLEINQKEFVIIENFWNEYQCVSVKSYCTKYQKPFKPINFSNNPLDTETFKNRDQATVFKQIPMQYRGSYRCDSESLETMEINLKLLISEIKELHKETIHLIAKLLYSWDYCPQQPFHTDDYELTRVTNWHDILFKDISLSAIIALEPNEKPTKLATKQYNTNTNSFEINSIILQQGSLILFRGDFVHAGAEYCYDNIRLFIGIGTLLFPHKGGEVAKDIEIQDNNHIVCNEKYYENLDTESIITEIDLSEYKRNLEIELENLDYFISDDEALEQRQQMKKTRSRQRRNVSNNNKKIADCFDDNHKEKCKRGKRKTKIGEEFKVK